MGVGAPVLQERAAETRREGDYRLLWLASFLLAAPIQVARAQAPSGGPTLSPAVLRSVTPAGVTRGGTATLTLDGANLAGATEAVFSDPAIQGVISAGAGRNQVRVRARVGADTQPGIHRVYLHTPQGSTGAVTFAVSRWPERQEQEPNDTPGNGPTHSLPATFTGRLDQVGDQDCFRFRAEAGQEVVFEVVASQIRSRLGSLLSVHGEDGRILAQTEGMESSPDALLSCRFPEAGTYAVRVRDLENQAGSDVTYRLNVAAASLATGVFPLGVGRDGGTITLTGPGLGAGTIVKLPASSGTTHILQDTSVGPLVRPVALAVGEDPEIREPEGSHGDAASAHPVALPSVVNGRIGTADETDWYRFTAARGRTVVLEVNARRLGSPLDSVVEVRDRAGRPIERATLRCVAETSLVLNDRDSASTGLRLLNWNELGIHDTMYIRGEVIQITALPRGPDDDVRFRAVRGQRAGLLETTPSGHAVNSPIYKVQVHPPGRTFPPNGMPVFRIHYRNDDGGPLYGKDSRLTFTPPTDGEYLVRLADVRGEGSDRHAYRLTIRDPRPDFRLALAVEHPNLPAGGRIPVEVTADRLDGFDGEIGVRLAGLPTGIQATETTIQAGENSATLLLSDTGGGPGLRAGGPLRLVGTARIGGKEQTREVEPAGGRARVMVLGEPDLVVTTPLPRLVVRPGTEFKMDARIERQHGFAGRVP
ncbi:MAG: hypothetical protein FJX77_11525, partial [Armatimonadetes bacterium]|nr:hypothetical protein [Armatimonadota bacterium]